MKIKIGFFLLILGACTFNAYAQTNPDDPAYAQHMQVVNQQLDQAEQQANKVPAASFNDRKNTFSINTQTFYSHYSASQKSRTAEGMWDGVEGTFIFRPPKGNVFDNSFFNFYAFEALYAKGGNKLEENEQRLSDNSISRVIIRDIPGYMFDNRVLIGKDFVFVPSVRLTPYTGLGVRYYTDHSAGHYNVFDNYLGSPVVALGYNFSDLFTYIPLGLRLDVAANKDYEINGNIEYDYLVGGYERDDYANFDQFTLPVDGFTNQNFRYPLNHGWGFRSSLKFIKHLCLTDIFLEPYLRYWHVDASKAESGFVDDQIYTTSANKNNTLEIGSTIGIDFY